TCFALLLPSDAALPWTREQRVIALAILDYAFVTYHFAAQHFGALSLYRMRLNRLKREQWHQVDRFFALTVGGLLVFVADLLAGSVAFQDLWIGRWVVTIVLATRERQIRAVALLALLAITGAMLLCEVLERKRSLPRVLYILGLSAMVA